MFKHKILLKIKGYNQEIFFNQLISKRIKIESVEKCEDFTIFKINSNDFKIVKSILQKLGLKIIDVNHLGIGKLKKNIIYRFGIVLGVFTALVLSFIANFFIFDIKITGCEKLNINEIKAFISKQGNGVFTLKTNTNTNNLELNLFKNFNKISMVSVSVKGCVIVVNIKEKEENVNEKEPNNIISTFNGRIKSVEVISGVSLVKSGDIVKIGDVLLSGQYEKPKAIIRAEIWLDSKKNTPMKSIVKEKTGKKIMFREITVFEKTIFSNIKKCNYKVYETETKFIKKKNSILPINIKYITYYEMEEREVVFDFEKEKLNIIDDCKKNTLQQVLKDDIIINEYSSSTNIANNINISYVIVVERIIEWS